MIIGRGSLSKLVNDREGFLFFAAGVSDSLIFDRNLTEAQREGIALANELDKALDANLMFVYFSTISIFTKQTQYTEHKKAMEYYIKLGSVNYTIIRLGNIWECTNPHTFINAYKAKPYEPRDEFKYMISREQLNFITDNLPRTGKHEISIFGEMKKVKDCLI